MTHLFISGMSSMTMTTTTKYIRVRSHLRKVNVPLPREKPQLSITNGSKSNLECVICLDSFIKPMVLNCGHTFCAKCIKRNGPICAVWRCKITSCVPNFAIMNSDTKAITNSDTKAITNSDTKAITNGGQKAIKRKAESDEEETYDEYNRIEDDFVFDPNMYTKEFLEPVKKLLAIKQSHDDDEDDFVFNPNDYPSDFLQPVLAIEDTRVNRQQHQLEYRGDEPDEFDAFF